MTGTPFTDPNLVAGPLYASAERLAGEPARCTQRRSAAGMRRLRPSASRRDTPCPPRWVCDISCGRGTTTLALANRLASARLIALDQSPALLNVVAARARRAGYRVETLCADFHHLLTARYLHRNGYRHSWPDVRPWWESKVPQ